MSITIELTAEEEARLRAAAEASGLPVEECAHHLLTRQLSTSPGDPTLNLLEAWDREDKTDDPNELAARVRDWEDVRTGLQAHPLILRTPDA